MSIKEAINSFGKKPFIALISYDMSDFIVCEPNRAKDHGVFFKFNPTNARPKSYTLHKFPIDFNRYKKRFDTVQAYQAAGDSYLLNLCFATPIKTDLSLEQIYKFASAQAVIYKKDDFVCFTPEPFVRIKDGVISTFPMKGTIDANVPNAREILLDNQKEFSEQAMITDLMRNDLSKVASSVIVERFRYVEQVGNLLQTSSCISGQIKAGLGFGDIFEALLPAGSITGTPKHRTCEIISECEIDKRGFYTGVFIHFDGAVCQSFVMIRFIKKDGENMKFYSGGGITTQSNAKEEYDELIRKIYLPF